MKILFVIDTIYTLCYYLNLNELILEQLHIIFPALQHIVLNSQGQQILLQRTPSTGNQPQNIIVRAGNQSGIVQVQPRTGQTAQIQSAQQALQVTTVCSTIKAVLRDCYKIRQHVGQYKQVVWSLTAVPST